MKVDYSLYINVYFYLGGDEADEDEPMHDEQVSGAVGSYSQPPSFSRRSDSNKTRETRANPPNKQTPSKQRPKKGKKGRGARAEKPILDEPAEEPDVDVRFSLGQPRSWD